MSRAYCPACERPQRTCLCDALVTLAPPCELVVLQDPTESRHALSSAPLLHRAIEGSRLVVDEVCQPEVLLGAQWRTDTLLIYPGSAALDGPKARARGFRRVLLLDGTWRKVRRLIHCNPWLLELPCLALTPDAGSEYRIRKSPRRDGLSTIEAAVAALNLLYPDQDYSPVLGAFHKMIDLQIAAMGDAVYRENYPA